MSFARYGTDGRLMEARALTFGEMAERAGLVERQAEAPAENGRRWYVVRRTSKTDAHALAWLARLGLQSYYPMMRALRPVPMRRLSRKQRTSGLPLMRPCVIPLFPSYIFVRLDLGRDRWSSVVSDIAGVGGMVSENNLPVEISPLLIAGIRACEIDGLVPGKTPAAMIFRVGENVHIRDGALAGFLATIEQTPDYTIADVDGDTRIRVAVELFGRTTPVDLTISQVEKL